MKRFLKISALVLAIILTAIIVLGVLLMSPPVQSALARKALDILQEKVDGKFEFSSLSIRPFDAIVINDFVWTDNNPYFNPDIPELAKADTVAKAKFLSVSFNAIGMLRGQPAMVRDLRIKDGEFFLVNEPDGNNLKRMFSKNKKDKNKEPMKIPDIEFFKADYVSIDGFRFRMINHRSPKPHRDRAMNWTDLDVSDIHLTIRNASLKGIVTEATVEHLDGREKSGYVINNVSGKARVYNRQVRIENLVMQDYWSDIHVPEFKMNYDRGIPSLNNFIEEVRLQAHIDPSRINMESVAYFAPTLHKMDIVAIIESADIDGYVNDLKVKNFQFHTPDNAVKGVAEGEIIGIPNTILMTTNYDVENMSFTPEGLDKFIKGWAPGVQFDFTRFLSGDRMTFRGKIRGPLNNAKISGTLTAQDRGTVRTNLQFGHLLEGGQNISIGGNVETNEFNAGSLAGTTALGPCTMHGGFKTTIGSGGISVKLDSLKIDHLRALDYDYKDLVAAGTYSGNAFDGTIFCNDHNLNFMFNGLFTLSNRTGDGAYKFVAELAYANLNALNIDKRGRSELSMRASANFKTLSSGDLLGNIHIGNVVLTDDEGRHNIGDISINSYMKNDVNKINLDSKFATLRYSGTGFLDSFVPDLIAVSAGKDLPSLFSRTPAQWSGNTYSLEFEAIDTKDVLSFVAPGVWIADGTKLNMTVNKEGFLNGRLTSQRLAIKDKYLKDIDLTLSNTSGHLEGDLFAEELKISAIKALDNNLKFVASDDKLGLNYSYDNKSEQENKGSLAIGGEIFKEGGKTALRAGLLPSQILLNDALWKLESTPVSISSKGIKVEKLTAESSDQSLVIEGGLSFAAADTLRFTMDNFNMAALTPFMGGILQAGGHATGHAFVLSPATGTPAILANMKIEDATLGGEKLGTIRLGSIWDESGKGYKARFRADLDSTRTLDFNGFISPSEKTFNGNLTLDNFNISCFGTALASVFSDVDGYVSGKVSADGTFGGGINLQSSGLSIHDGLLRVAFTNVPYKVDGDISLNSNGVSFDDVSVHDKNGANGRITGGISWKNFKDFRLNIGMDIDKMQVLDLEENMNPAFYGRIAATGKASLEGPIEAIMLKADAQTVGQGELHIPMNASSSMARSNLLVFKAPEPEKKSDLYEEMLLKTRIKEKRENRFATEISVQAHPGIEAVIEVDKASGNVLTGHGNGNIQLSVQPSNGMLNLGGNFTVTDGTYHFAALGIAKRDFTILDGGTVKFAGDVMDTDLNIRAMYRTKTSLATLLSDTTSTASRRWVECGINITDKIKSPRIEFTIDVPDIDPTTAARVESALNTEDKMQKQFLSLLISGGFLPDDPSGVVNNSSMIGTTVADLMASQLTNVLQKLDIPIDLGLDYQQNASGADIFEVAVSTQLFNNRISINGTFGNRQNSATSRQDVVGDLDAEIKLTRNGSIRATAFHHTADQYTNYLDNLKRNGIGLSFQTEFNTIGELFHGLFPWLFRNAIKNEDAIVEEEEERTVIIIDEDD